MMYLSLHIQRKNNISEFCSAKWPVFLPKALKEVNLPCKAAPAVPAESSVPPAGRVTRQRHPAEPRGSALAPGAAMLPCGAGGSRAGGAAEDHRRGRRCPKMLQQVGGCTEALIPSLLNEVRLQPAASWAQQWGAPRSIGVRGGGTCLRTTSLQQAPQLRGGG